MMVAYVYRLNFSETILTIAFGIIAVLPCLETLNSYTIEDKSLVLARPNQ